MEARLVIPYVPRTGTRSTIAKLRARGWRLLLNVLEIRDPMGFRYALDNGAWPAAEDFNKGKRPTKVLCLETFARGVAAMGPGADFVVAPDIVQGGEESWQLTSDWLPKLVGNPRLSDVVILIAVQDGFELEPERIRRLLDRRVGIFVGGGDAFKEQSLPLWGAMCREAGAWLHVGRVNTTRRVALCEAAGATSFDGLSVARFPVNLAKLDGARRQTDIENFLASRSAA